MKKTIIIIVLILSLGAFSQSNAQAPFVGKPQYQIEIKRADTLMGKIIVEMFPAIAPNHVRNWDSLVGIHFYDSVAFHRVIPGFMIQGGDPNSRSGPRSTWGYGEDGQTTIDAEFSSVSHQRGILSAARTNDPNSATSQFFICIGKPTSLDRQYSVYGHVVSGMSVADSIVSAPRDANDNPLEKISMFITRIGENDSLTATPQLVLPLNEATLASVTSTALRWRKVSDAMLYRLQVSTDQSFNDLFIDSSLRQIDTSMTARKLAAGTTYYWRVLANNGGNASAYSDVWSFSIPSASAVDESETSLRLDAIVPNPLHSVATLRFDLKRASTVNITITDLLGHIVLRPVESQTFGSGEHEVAFNASMLSSGTYVCRLESDGMSVSKQIVIE